LDWGDVVNYSQFNAERDKDEIIVTNDRMWDVIDSDKQLVMSVREARRLSEVLLDATTSVNMFSEEEDG
jgi:hypothetical protein